MNTAEYITSLIAGKVVELAAIGAGWSLFYTQRFLFAASPKPQAPPQRKDEPKTEAPKAPAEPAPLWTLGGAETPAAPLPSVAAALEEAA